MKLASFGDFHGHLWKEFDMKGGETGSIRLDIQISALRCIRAKCIERGITHLLFAGDLHHARGAVNTLVFNAIYNEIAEFAKHGITIIMIAGNHDQVDNSDVPENSLHPYKKLEKVFVYDTVGTHIIRVYETRDILLPGRVESHESTEQITEEVEIVLAPYSKNAQMIKDYIAGVEKKDIPQILLFHLGISGAFVGKGNYPMADAFQIEDLRPDLFKYIIGGHFHRHQLLGGHPHAFYTGAPIPHSFSDEGEDKGFYIVDTNKRWDVEFVPIPSPKFVTFEGALKDDDIGHLLMCNERRDYVRIICNEEQLEQYKQIIPDGLQYKVELRKEYEQQERSAVKTGMGPEEVVKVYAEENNPEALEKGLELIREAMK